ncbi:MAG: class I SAM-dependent methyltransferase [Bryobacteraceae bacterium]
MESAELIEILREVRDRVRARHPQTAGGAAEIPLADFTALVRARDAALGKVAAIGTVNPRPGGLGNALVQAWKRFVARVLEWHVREQIVFNRKTVACIDATIEALADTNRALAAATAAHNAAIESAFSDISGRLAAIERLVGEQNASFTALRGAISSVEVELGDIRKHWVEWRAGWEHKLAEIAAIVATMKGVELEFGDMRKHWAEWRAGWEYKLAQNEVQFLRGVADLQSAFSYRADLMDANYRDTARGQHADFRAALDTQTVEIQRRLWADLEKVKLEYERLIYTELRVIRQRLWAMETRGAEAPAAGRIEGPPAPAALDALDTSRFAERFRGSEEHTKAGQRFYLDYFAGRAGVLDIGCGRGEFLELMREAGAPATGIDLSEECVAVCREKGLDAREADLFVYLAALPESSLDGIFCAQVVEHLPPGRLPEMIRLCASRLSRGGVLAIETPNPECLVIFATHFYLDPTHVRPVPAPLLRFYFEENGLGTIEIRKLYPAVETVPALASLSEDLRTALFGGLDYAIIGKKL